ncbi:DUF4973 domain-containing protein [Dysgonomonas sp. Marseille-P4361]|uniref:DUF4973 domain-containing protein n=1 Tax=Dysgonomonas sp. Marseille-P4361 TaxID=2161820 RepID=UPI000D5544B7|nr:DUF4973 domain-containing protein [Dysgonomonas sp. Marseille-P4361]
MRNIYYYIIVLSTLLLLSSCNDEWKDELYTNMVSLKAPINRDDVSVIYLRYKPEGLVSYKLPVIVSGSKINNRDYNVRIGVDNDTLAILNYARYTHREDLYYKQLPESFFEFPSNVCHIPTDSNVALFNINFKFSGIDLSEKWVLPLTIEDDPSYVMNMYKGRRKALLWILPFNDYSGDYSATGMNIYYGDDTSNQTVVSSREARVVDDNTVFFYAGLTEEKDINRSKYKIFVKFKDVDRVSEDGSQIGKLELTSDNPEINLELLSEPTYEIREEMDIDKPHIKKRFITLRMSYKYEDYTSISTRRQPYRCDGSMIMQRNINILVPDEDQAIVW